MVTVAVLLPVVVESRTEEGCRRGGRICCATALTYRPSPVQSVKGVLAVTQTLVSLPVGRAGVGVWGEGQAGDPLVPSVSRCLLDASPAQRPPFVSAQFKGEKGEARAWTLHYPLDQEPAAVAKGSDGVRWVGKRW